jgi:hypothetical protein
VPFPEIVGARLPVVTVTVAASELLRVPSLTVIVIVDAPTSPAAGVPVNAPDVALNASHAGLPVTENDSVLPSGSEAVGVNEYAWPTVTVCVPLPEIVGARFAAVTVIVADRELLRVPSLAVIVTVDAPTSPAAGVPVSAPVVALNASQAGLPATEKESVLPSGSDAVGVNEYAWPTVTVCVPLPEIVGARFPEITVIVNVTAAESAPSETEIVTVELPTVPTPGVPWSRPVVVLNVAHDGRPTIANVSADPRPSA